MTDKKITNAQKWKYTLITSLIFLVVSHPLTYKLVQRIFGRFFTVASSTGCPTMIGLLLHTLVFTLILRLKMN